jgi:hypothetical protein
MNEQAKSRLLELMFFVVPDPDELSLMTFWQEPSQSTLMRVKQ